MIKYNIVLKHIEIKYLKNAFVMILNYYNKRLLSIEILKYFLKLIQNFIVIFFYLNLLFFNINNIYLN